MSTAKLLSFLFSQKLFYSPSLHLKIRKDSGQYHKLWVTTLPLFENGSYTYDMRITLVCSHIHWCMLLWCTLHSCSYVLAVCKYFFALFTI